MQCKPRQLERWLAPVGQGTADRQAVAADDLRFRVLPRGHAPLNVPHPPHLLFERGLRMVVRRGDQLGSFLQIVVLAELVRDLRHDLLHGEANGGLAVGNDGVDRHGQRLLDLAQQVRQVSFARTIEAARQQHLARQHVAQDPQHVLILVRLQAINGEDHLLVRRQTVFEPRVVGEAQRHQLLVARHEMGDGAFGNCHLPIAQRLMDLRDTAMLGETQGADEGNHVEAELVMGQRPGAFFLGTVGSVVARTLRIVAADHGQREAADVGEGGDGAVVLVHVPQAAPTVGTGAAYGDQVDAAGDRRAFGTAGHGSTPQTKQDSRLKPLFYARRTYFSYVYHYSYPPATA